MCDIKIANSISIIYYCFHPKNSQQLSHIALDVSAAMWCLFFVKIDKYISATKESSRNEAHGKCLHLM